MENCRKFGSQLNTFHTRYISLLSILYSVSWLFIDMNDINFLYHEEFAKFWICFSNEIKKIVKKVTNFFYKND